MLRSVVSILLEGVPPHVNYERVKKALSQIEGVSDVHDLHIWAISSGKTVLTAHFRAVNPSQAMEAAHQACGRLGINHCTFQVQQFSDEACHSQSCATGDCA